MSGCSHVKPFLPFTKPSIDEVTISEVCNVLRSGCLTGGGPKVRQFEETLSSYWGGTRPVRTFNSATSALETALRVAGIGPGDEVITTPLSWVATANVILSVGAKPVFVDIDPATRNLDLAKAEVAITSRTKGIVPVYMAGLPMDMEVLYALARRHGLRVIEDAAQAIGSMWDEKLVGSFGDLVVFSFQANKNITTGEGGCLVLNTDEETAMAEKLRFQGVTRTGTDGMEVDVLGGKYNMTEMAAAIGLGQFRALEQVTRKRQALARHYFAAFGPEFETQTGAQLPPSGNEKGRSNWHMFQIVLPHGWSRAEFQQLMKTRYQVGIGCHYPAIHLFKLYRQLGYKEGMFPIAESVGRKIVTLPLFGDMVEADVERVVAAVKEILIP
ncbi:Spore coat polysaccharide biosynthesis protein SpsC [Madurella mycetomatis]|uniref:Spore coat polysaccharide biosynthesis protein SpsC n=1 Tax=Madurella mycetomatis TaxID=100816 RepID=A0A175W0P8_9PEZI|nr:Spore coat polysaccharide biosynthesis protein SpsC [Madurella mycetomatis]